MTATPDALLHFASLCEDNAKNWFAVAAQGNSNFVDVATIDAIDTAITWQARADALRARAVSHD